MIEACDVFEVRTPNYCLSTDTLFIVSCRFIAVTLRFRRWSYMMVQTEHAGIKASTTFDRSTPQGAARRGAWAGAVCRGA